MEKPLAPLRQPAVFQGKELQAEIKGRKLPATFQPYACFGRALGVFKTGKLGFKNQEIW